MAAMSGDEDNTLYCLCQQPYDDSQFMIECDVCNDWFHGTCVGVEEYQASDIDIYHCPTCQLTYGPLQLKNKRSRKIFTKRVYDETDSIPITNNVKGFIDGLKNRKFAKPDRILKELRGYELDKDFIDKNGFSFPILVKSSDGLDLRVPPPTFTVDDVELAVGSMRELDVIDVAKQSDAKMLMREFVDYYNKPKKERILNVISLEFSKTKLSDMVTPPRIVDELSWVTKYWPEHTGETRTFIRPEVQKYCLMSVKDSYTDFHVDFGGTSVWYHVIKGKKIFYLIEPTDTNLALYETWTSSASQNTIFFGDQVDICYKMVIEPGQTLFIPTGWIHGVYTPNDSLVFGGNFLHDYNIGMQLQIYEMENRIATPVRFQFPNFETLCWFAAKNLTDNLNAALDGGRKLSKHVLIGVKVLRQHLYSWMTSKDTKVCKKHKEFLPEGIAHIRLLKQLAKLIEKNEKEDSPRRDTQLNARLKAENYDQQIDKQTDKTQERQSLLGLKFKFNKIDNSLLKLKTCAQTNHVSKPDTNVDNDGYDNSEEERLKSCYSDDTYVYPPLLDSDDEEPKPKKKRKNNDTSTSWTPKSRNNLDRSHASSNSSDNHLSQKPSKVSIHKHGSTTTKYEQPGTSNGYQKPKSKRGTTTAKQRLGKLLKIHKFIQSNN